MNVFQHSGYVLDLRTHPGQVANARQAATGVLTALKIPVVFGRVCQARHVHKSRVMQKLYLAVDMGLTSVRVMWGALQDGRITMGEAGQFENVPLQGKGGFQWNIPEIYRGITEAMCQMGVQEVGVNGVSCHSWSSDFMLFSKDGSVLTPVSRRIDSDDLSGMEKVNELVKWEELYEETGVQRLPGNTLFQLANESSRRLTRADQLMPMADGINYLFSGVRSVEASLASATQVFNPRANSWSPFLMKALGLPSELFPQVVKSGTKLGLLRPELVKETKLEDARVVATCSNEFANALASLPVAEGEDWAYLRLGREAVVGTQIPDPLINDVTRELGYSNEVCLGGTNFFKRAPGLWILDECRRYWTEHDRELCGDILLHLATTCPAFESLINPDDARFSEPGDMPAKVQAYCRETEQEVPRKPGQIVRCVLESLALYYRKVVQETGALTGRRFSRYYLFGGGENMLLNHLITNALQAPVVLVSPDAAPIGNILIQAQALGHIQSPIQARDIVRESFKSNIIIPHHVDWDGAYNRFVELAGCTPATA